jgi:hypothetical protein
MWARGDPASTAILQPGMTRLICGAPLLAVLALSGCDMHSGAAPPSPPGQSGVALEGGWGLATPGQIGDFERVDVSKSDHSTPGVTAGYSQTVGSDNVIATIRVHPAGAGDTLLPSVNLGGGGIDADASAQALARSIAQVRRFYPKAALLTEAPAFLFQKGALQSGKSAVLEYHELHAGQPRTMQLKIYSFCCGAGQWAYEYRFRYPAGLDAEFGIVTFMRATAWEPPRAS